MNMKRIIISIFAMIIGMGPIFAGAHKKGMFTVTVDNEAAYGTTADSLATSLDDMLKQKDFAKTLNYMADSQSMATRGLGTTYATNHSLFIVGGSFNLGASPGSRTIPEFAANPWGTTGASSVPELGLGVQLSAFLGLSLKAFNLKPIGFLDLSRLTVFANYFAYNLDNPALRAKTNALGFHIQYKIINEASLAFGLLHWGGVDITTGLDIASNTLAIPMKSFLSTTTAGSGASSLNFTPTGDLSFINTAVTIPIEASTNIRIAYLLSVILGAAVDINMGNAKLDLGKVNITDSTGARVGDLTINEGGTMGASFADLRFFFGPQINIIPLPSGKNMLSLTALVNVSTNNTYGAHISLNAGF